MPEGPASYRVRNRPATPATHAFAMAGRLADIAARYQAGLAQPFKGVTADGAVAGGLFALEKTGRPLKPLVEAALALLEAFTPAQRMAASFPIDSEAWRQWSNVHPFIVRHGVCLTELDGAQRERVFGLLAAALSPAGYQTARDVMKLNENILEITGRADEYGEWYYWVSVFGTPSQAEPWGWQIDGHHLNLNCFVVGDQMVLTPQFMGSEPVLATFGKYQGTRVFAEEEAQGYRLMSGFSPEQRARATIGMKLPFEAFTAAGQDNAVLKHEGLPYAEMNAEQKERLEALMGFYCGRLRAGHAELRFAEAKRHLDRTKFAWIGKCDETSPFYYNIYSPVILIEFDHQAGIALDNDEPTRDHIHTVVRTPNGNDYGRDLLRQHYRQFDHASPASQHRRGKA